MFVVLLIDNHKRELCIPVDRAVLAQFYPQTCVKLSG